MVSGDGRKSCVLPQMIERAMTDEALTEDNTKNAPKLMEVIIQHCQGRVDACIPRYLALSLQRLATAETRLMKVRPLRLPLFPHTRLLHGPPSPVLNSFCASRIAESYPVTCS